MIDRERAPARRPAPRSSRGASASRVVVPDLEAATKSVRSTSISRSSARIAAGCVVSRTWNALDAERLRGSPRARGSSRPCRAGRRRRSRRRPARRTARAQGEPRASAPARRASRATSPRPRRSRPTRRAPRSCGRALALDRRSRGYELAALGADAVEQLGERVGELLHALGLERRDDVVVVDAGVARARRSAAAPRRRPRAPSRLHLAVVLEGRDRLVRHRVDGLGRDQLLDVHHVAVVRVLRRGRRPEAALLRRALALEVLPARAGVGLEPVLVGELRVRDRELAPSARRGRRSRPAGGPPRCRRARRRSSRPTRPGRVAAARRPAARARAGTPRRPPCSAGARRSA